jgi:hypothetical protein
VGERGVGDSMGAPQSPVAERDNANHSEINYIPRNLFGVKIPDGVDDLDASYVTVGSIALQGVSRRIRLS